MTDTQQTQRRAEVDPGIWAVAAPILQNRCQECHRPGQVGPFSLMTFRQAVTLIDDQGLRKLLCRVLAKKKVLLLA